VGTKGRQSGQVRLRLVKHTDSETLRQHVQTFTRGQAYANTDEWTSYKRLERKHATVNRGAYEWAGTMMAMGFAKFTSTRLKAGGPVFAIICARFVVFTNVT
jgi:hypothetical protein